MKESVLTLWLKELRAPFFTASVIPILLGAAVAWSKGFPFSWGLFILTLLGGVLLHAGANVSNDYYDHKSGTDDINVEFVNPFTGGSRMIQKGLMTPRQVLQIVIMGRLCFSARAKVRALRTSPNFSSFSCKTPAPVQEAVVISSRSIPSVGYTCMTD